MMDKILRDLCTTHGLYCINVQFLADTEPCLFVHLHWSEPGTVRCVSGKGSTFEEAFAAALPNLAAARTDRLSGDDLQDMAVGLYAALSWDATLPGSDVPVITDAMMGGVR